MGWGGAGGFAPGNSLDWRAGTFRALSEPVGIKMVVTRVGGFDTIQLPYLLSLRHKSMILLAQGQG